MISPAKATPVAARNYMATKIKLLNTGAIRSSPQAQERICQFRQHDLNTCPACTFEIKSKDKMPAKLSAYDDEDSKQTFHHGRQDKAKEDKEDKANPATQEDKIRTLVHIFLYNTKQ
ncbi:hypothetical protein ACOSQ3_003881 [Xanthoceras sorbifolium]